MEHGAESKGRRAGIEKQESRKQRIELRTLPAGRQARTENTKLPQSWEGFNELYYFKIQAFKITTI
jgi:hypothetical protein